MQESIIEEKLKKFVKSSLPDTKLEIIKWYSEYLILFYLISVYKENSSELRELHKLVRFRNIMEHEFPKVNCVRKINRAKLAIENELESILKETKGIWKFMQNWE